MGLISRMAIKNQISLGEFDRMIEEAMGGRITKSGAKVSESTALSLIEVQKCVRVRAETRGCLPVSIYRKRRDGRGRDEARDHPLYEILNVAPNSEMDSQTFYERMEIYFSLWGNDVSIITRNTSRNKNVTDLYPVPWYKMRVKRDPDTWQIYYEYNDRGKLEKFPAERVFHLRGMSFDGLVGIGTIGMAREAVGQGLAMAEFANRFFGQGMNMGGILESPNKLSKEARDNMRKAAKEMGGGLANAWEPFLLEEGTKWNRIPMSFVDAQFIEVMNLNKYDIDGLFRVPPHMVANLERSTNNNIEHQGIEFVTYSLLPMITRFERMANWKLLTPQDRAAGYYVKVNVDALLRGDAVSRGEYLQKKRQNGALSANDWRELDDENPTGVPGGDAYLVNGNMISLETAARQQPKQAQVTVAKALSYYGRYGPLNKKNEDKLSEVKQVIKTLSKDDKAELGPRYFYDDAQYRYIVERDDKPVGFIENRATGKKGHFNLAVDPGYRGQGIADEMVDQAIADAPAELSNIEKILWVTTEGNEASRALAEKHGFELTSEEDGEVKYTYWLNGGEGK